MWLGRILIMIYLTGTKLVALAAQERKDKCERRRGSSISADSNMEWKSPPGQVLQDKLSTHTPISGGRFTPRENYIQVCSLFMTVRIYQSEY